MNGMSADDDRVPRAARHGLDVVEHVGHRDRDLVLVAEDHAPDGVADEQQRDAGLVEQARRRVVVRGQHRDPLAVGVDPRDVGDGQAGAGRGAGGRGRGWLSGVVPADGSDGCYRAISGSPGSLRAGIALVQRGRHAVQEPIGNLALRQHRPRLRLRPGRIDRDAVRVRAEAGPRLGHVVGDEQVEALRVQLAGGPVERAGLRREPDEDRAGPERLRPGPGRGRGRSGRPRPGCRASARARGSVRRRADSFDRGGR